MGSWWRHQMETFSALLAFCEGNSPVTGEFPSQRPGTQRFDVSFVLRLNKRLCKQSWGWWFETPSRSLWRHCNEKHVPMVMVKIVIFSASWMTGAHGNMTIRVSNILFKLNYFCHVIFALSSLIFCKERLVCVISKRFWSCIPRNKAELFKFLSRNNYLT